ncbi:MAG TPA: ABC transporter permease [Gemmatimonadales bacterium]|nr:ABC transporter permease [Gemmatimonadales bacterium]
MLLRLPLWRALIRAGDFVVGMALLVVIWYILYYWIDNPFLFPTPRTVLVAGIEMSRTGEIFEHSIASLRRIGVGYVMGVSLGIALGILLGQISLLNRFVGPIINSIRMLPPVALIPLAIIWFGIGEGSKYFVVLWGTVIACYFSTMDGVMNAPRARVQAARCMGASRMRVVWDVVLPSALPSIWTGMKISVGLAFSSVVAAELVAAREGVGYLIMNARVLIEVDKLFVGMALLALLGAVLDRLFTSAGETFLSRYLDYVRG